MASGNTQEDFVPGDAIYQSANPVALVYDQGRLVYSFPATANGWLVFNGMLGYQYGGTGLTINVVWVCPGTVGVVKWGVSVLRLNNGLVYPVSPTWTNQVTDVVTVAGTAYQIVYTSLVLSNAQLNGVQPGEIYQLGFWRDVSPGGNSASVAELIRLTAVET